MITALLTAAGTGSRMHQDIPKQFMHVGDRPILIHTLERFQQHPSIDSIIVVTLENWVDVVKAYANQFNITKLKWVVPGGDTGQESIYNGLQELANHCNDDDVVMIHDGNRCNVSQEVISNSIATFKEHGSAIAAIPCVEAVFRSADGVSSEEQIPRDELWRTQTPHTYSFKKIKWAYDEAINRGITSAVASCTLMQMLGEKVWFSQGSEENLKITTVEDLKIFESLLSCSKKAWLK